MGNFLLSILKHLGISNVLETYIADVGITAVEAKTVEFAQGIYAAQGHDAAVRIVTIPEATIAAVASAEYSKLYGSATGPGYDAFLANIEAKNRAFAESFADLAGAFIPPSPPSVPASAAA